MRVLTFLYSFAPGGVERVAARLHAAWTADGVDARIVLADASVAPPRPLDHVAQIDAVAKRGMRGAFALARGLPARVAEQRPDILFCAGNTYTALAVALRLVLGRACPPIVAKISNCLVRPDMPPTLRFFYGIWLRIQGRYIDHFVGLAPAMRDEIAQAIGAPQRRISIIADPALCHVELARLAAARDAAPPRTVPGRQYLAVGRLAPQKNFALLLEAFARIATAHDTLTILGDGPERPTLERLAASLGIADALRLPGHVDPIADWMATADMFVLSSDYEGVPAVVIEALAAGLPIVATDCCVSMRDLLGHGALGRIVATGDAAALAAAIRVGGPDDAATVAARRAAAAQFTIERAAEAYLVLMRSLVSARARAAAPAAASAYEALAAD